MPDRALRRARPDDAAVILRVAGQGTGDYLLARRIPKPAQVALRLLPRRARGPLLARAIARHAWTFAGSGAFRILSLRPVVFELAGNPLIRGEAAGAPMCVWHAAVLTRLFAALVDPAATVAETGCCGCGDPACRFELRAAVNPA